MGPKHRLSSLSVFFFYFKLSFLISSPATRGAPEISLRLGDMTLLRRCQSWHWFVVGGHFGVRCQASRRQYFKSYHVLFPNPPLNQQQRNGRFEVKYRFSPLPTSRLFHAMPLSGPDLVMPAQRRDALVWIDCEVCC